MVLLVSTPLWGCASIYHSDVALVPVTSTPSGATVTVGNQTYTTPAMVPGRRGEGGFVLEVSKQGYLPRKVAVIDSLGGWIWGNLWLGWPVGAAIGAGIDVISGKGYGFDPEMVHVDLTPEAAR
ncbi:MAG: hypothetical protein COX57_11795 [Alphaproteobacteria bacterium CG_4_10_14_0_2_um_filter_63_37]|nr:MAG: hypothetical protein AUJ55_06305 [Proteobacteria bacterium CG1_02_64_396]PJA23794.1 MAG: hypothetical protein COX57_11795 [Alphaproteobacteria bacterium CG_4_10_14_0_2_um_filter_63_37]